MKKMSRVLSLALVVMMALAMLLSASGIEIFIIASSDDYAGYTTSAKYLETISVMKGYGDGDLHLEEPIERYQAALFFGRVLTGVTDETAWGMNASTMYTDVPQYGDVIDLISVMGIIRGYGDGTYGYHDRIRYQDMCAMLVRALGYETETMVASYPMSYVLKVEDLGLDLKNVKPADYLNRGQTAQMIYDALTTPVSNGVDDETTALAKVLAAVKGVDLDVNEEKTTYLERNFDVSGTMYFRIVATEKYKVAGAAFAEEGKFNALCLVKNADGRYVESYVDADGNTVSAETWSFPIEGSTVADVSEADLVGKYMTLVFDDKTPTQEELEDETCTIVHAEIAASDLYENLGDMGYVKIEDEVLTLGKTTIKFSSAFAPVVRCYQADKASLLSTTDLAGLETLLTANTYCRIDAVDFDDDGNYDELIYTPYTFGQYVTRTYSGKTYTMIGRYTENAVYDLSAGTAKTNENTTHFVEYFLPVENRKTASSLSNYKPGDTTIRVGDAGENSNTVSVLGASAQSGDFVLYAYNEMTNKLYIGAALGTMQTGTLTGIKPSAQTYTVDGSAMGVGMPGSLSDRNCGLLNADTGFSLTKSMASALISNYEKGEQNLRYLEYDGKLVYMEAYGDSEIEVGGEYAILDAEATLDDYKESLANEKDAWDLPYEGDTVLVDRYDPATGALTRIKVESITVCTEGNPAGETYNFRNIDYRHDVGVVPDLYAYDLLTKNGVLYMIEDEDEDGAYELYAYGTEAFHILGAPVIAKENAPTVYFAYGKSNLFVAENALGISTDRVQTHANFVTVVVGQDGYATYTGVIDGQNENHEANDLYLSAAAKILDLDSDMLVIFDPVGYLDEAAEAQNLYANYKSSIWNADGTSENCAYYMMIKASTFVDTSLYCEDDGTPIKTSDGKTLYVHTYRKLLNLETFKNEDVKIITTNSDAPATEVVNSIEGVIYVKADTYETGLTSFAEVFVENGDYRVGSLSRLADKDKVSFTTEEKDINGNGVIDEGEGPQSCFHDADNDLEYGALDALNITYIDLDEGAGVNYREYSFADSYLFYNYGESNAKYYASVTLTDRPVQGEDYPAATFPIRRFNYAGTEFSDKATNGKVTTMTKGDRGYYGDASFWRWNGWADYLIPAVDSTGNVIWSYQGSLRVHTTYYSFINYDEEANTADFVIVRVGQIVGVIGTDTQYEGD